MSPQVITQFSKKIIDFKLKKNDIPEGEAFALWKLRNLPDREFNQLSALEKLLYLCAFGILAPTSHNSSPEKFQLFPQDNLIELWLDPKYILPYSDPIGRQACISIGCVVANICVAAECYGLITKIKYFPIEQEKIKPGKSKNYIRLLSLKLEKGSLTRDKIWLDAIRQRKVVRAEFDDKVKLKKELIKEFEDLVKDSYPDLSFYLFTDREKLHQAGKLQEDADRTVFEEDNFSKELGEWILLNSDKREGVKMRGSEFGFTDDFTSQIRNGLLHKQGLAADQMAFFARGGRVAIESSSALGVICCKNDRVEDWLKCGQALEELALKIQLKKLYISIHTGIVHIDWVKNIFKSTVLGSSDKPSALFRIGFPKRKIDLQRPHSSRPRLESLILP